MNGQLLKKCECFPLGIKTAL